MHAHAVSRRRFLAPPWFSDDDLVARSKRLQGVPRPLLLQSLNQLKGTASELLDDQTGELARWSRLSESNRRPSHYEEDFQRCIRPLQASLLTRPHAPGADSTMGFQDFAPRVAPRGSPSPVALASLLLPDHRGSPVSWSHHWVWFGGRLNTSELSEDRRRPAGHGRAHDRLDQLEPLRTAADQGAAELLTSYVPFKGGPAGLLRPAWIRPNRRVRP